MILLYITIALFVLYSILIVYYWRAWISVPLFKKKESSQDLYITVIIPARNEEENIGALLDALQRQHYPQTLFETIVIDDHSADNTASIVKNYPAVRLISLKENNINSYKKKAIETGIAASKGDLIVTTDADCIPHPGWLDTIAAFKKVKGSDAVTGPVVIDCNNSVLEILQAMDFMVLQGVTGASISNNIHSMGNGANLAYSKTAFEEVGGFSGVDHIASGDDMLLLYKIWKKNPGRVHYLKSKEAMVSTQPMKTWKDFFNERIRWASKARQYQDKRLLPVLLLVYLFNLSFIALLIGGCWLWAAGLLIAKTLIELPLFYSVAKFFNKSWAVYHFIFFQPLHILYTLLSGFLGQFGSYHWKGRKVK